MKTRILLLPILGTLLAPVMADDLTFQLALDLLKENSHELAAVEFRRFAMETDQQPEQSAAFLYSGYAYLQAGQGLSTEEMLDRAESADRASAYANEHSLLSAENARLMKDPDTALYFYDLLSEDPENSDFQTFAIRRSAAIELARGDILAARIQLENSLGDETASLRALDAFANGKDKSPLIGGLWGLIPGAGYWYSGETANGFRSLLLNSLFIFGMVNTAQEEQWGAFAAIAFFEVTWYSGSIYGGVDSAQRHNKDRLDAAIYAIDGRTSYQPDPGITAPIFKLKILF